MQKTIRKSGKLALAFDKAFPWPVLLSLGIFLLNVVQISLDSDLVAMIDQFKIAGDLELQLLVFVGILSGLFFTVLLSFFYFVYLLIAAFFASRKEVPGNE